MAQPAANIITNPYWRHIFRLLVRPSAGRLGHTLRVTIAGMIGVLIGEIWQLPAMDIIPIIILAIWQEDRMLNLTIGKTALIFFAFVMSAVYFATVFSINNFFLTLFVNLIFSFVFFFLGSASKLKGIALVGGLFLSYILLQIDVISHSDTVTRIILYVTLALAISCGSFIVLGFPLSPSPQRVLMGRIAYRLRTAADHLIDPTSLKFTEETKDLLRQGTQGMLVNLALASKEKLLSAQDLLSLRQAALHSYAILTLVNKSTRSSPLPSREERRELASLLLEMAQAFDENSYLRNVKSPTFSHPILQSISPLLEQFSVPSEDPLPPAPPAPGFFVPDAFSNPNYVLYATKGTAAVFINIVIFKCLNWPGIHTCVITCFVVALPTMGEVISKQTLRIIGSFIGCGFAMLGIIFLIPHFISIAQLLLFLGVVLLVSGWLNSGESRIAYIGLQIAIAFFLSDLTNSTPATDLTVPRDRVIGIMIGLFINYIMHTYLWPKSCGTQIGPQLQAIKDLLKAESNASTSVERIVFASKVQERIAATEIMLENSVLEPIPFRLTRATRAHYRYVLMKASLSMEDFLLPASSSVREISPP
ncbi:fusaric acid resistance protein [Saccharibacter sp. 17.LH.SD]|uniref:FUSC family protein n=1 Tax=Saccharibacter sp. 17.LH.SD TaxID=2689393 RepID=UPI0013686FAE|nr:FUSC family protein [Saccharibacter sp. 17.LH.SD]MXV44924.1 fusaric acid resistance protein [Saccharibacter sp. 17.LH.SD]